MHKSRLLWLRNAVRAGFLAFILFLVFAHSESATGSGLPSAESFCPLGGLESLWNFIASGGKTLRHIHLSNFVILAALLLTTLVAGGFFCGWICPVGTLQDVFSWVGKRLGIKPRNIRARAPWTYAKYVVLSVIIALTIITGDLVYRSYDPFAAFFGLRELTVGVGSVLLLAIFTAALFGKRFWCTYLCPLGALVNISSKVGLWQIKRDKASCISCGLCDRKCPTGLGISKLGSSKEGFCIGCYNCVESCPREGALVVQLGSSAAKGGVVVEN